MFELKKILVGVDLLQSEQGSFSPPVAAAIRQALWLGERLASEVTFFSAVDLPEEGVPEKRPGDRKWLVGQIQSSVEYALNKLVKQAGEQGVKAAQNWTIGQGWVELAREAIEGRYDMVVVGTRNQGALRRALFGSTALKLVRNCPAPVWVTKPEPAAAPSRLLVASDFSEVSDRALALALQLGAQAKAQVHLLHVLESPFARLWESGLVEARREEFYHAQDRVAAEGQLRKQLGRVAEVGVEGVRTVVIEGASVADDAIVQYIDAHRIDLLVAGTSARRGLSGMFLGNTAERLLTAVHCSLLTVKPADFVCPIPMEQFVAGNALVNSGH